METALEKSFQATSVIVTDPEAAGKHSPWMANVKAGTTLTAHRWGVDQLACVELKEVHPKFFTRTQHYLCGGRIAVYPADIATDLIHLPVRARVGGEEVILARDSKGLALIRKLRQYDTSSVSGAKLWRFGQKMPDSNVTYILEKEVATLKKVNRREERAELESLRACYPWTEKENLHNTSTELYLEDLYLKMRKEEGRLNEELNHQTFLLRKAIKTPGEQNNICR